MLEIAATALMLGLLAPATTVAASAKTPRITSAYTTFDWQKCPIIRSGEQEAQGRERPDDWQVRRCDDYAGIPLLGDGKPFAIIYRAKAFVYQAEAAPELVWSRLIVETVGQPRKPGCSIAIVDALKPNSNIAARRAAVALLAGKAHCISLSE